MSSWLDAVVLAAVAALAVLLGTAPVLRALPEPAPSEAADKLPYHRLAVPPFVHACVLFAAAAALIAGVTLPPSVLPYWLVLATVGVLLATIDAGTTWLPLPLTRWAWLLLVPAAAVALSLGAVPADVGRAGLGAVVAGGLYFLLWLVTRGGIAFGDVRFAPLIGAAAAAHSWSLLIGALMLGTLAGGVYGIIRLARGRRDGFAYAPSMLLGPFLASVLTYFRS